jgi:hypothetical protein
MSRLAYQLDEIARELTEDIENLKRLAEAIPQLLESKQKQLARIADVSRSMVSEDDDVTALLARYSSPPAKRGRGPRGRTLPTDIMSLIHAAGARGATLDELHVGLSKSREISRQNLSSTLSRMKSQGKIAKHGGNFVAKSS